MTRGVFAAVLAFGSVFPACNRSRDENFVVVSVFRDADSDFRRDLDGTLYAFNGGLHRTSSGKVIRVATQEGDYQRDLARKLTIGKTQLIILDSPSDASFLGGMPVDLQKARSACGRTRNCPAFIPPWVSGEKQQAANLILSAMARDPAGQ